MAGSRLVIATDADRRRPRPSARQSSRARRSTGATSCSTPTSSAYSRGLRRSSVAGRREAG
jgi:hypothetical protein